MREITKKQIRKRVSEVRSVTDVTPFCSLIFPH